MSEITALDTASTDDLVAALAIRYRVRLAEACGGITDPPTMLQAMHETMQDFCDHLVEPMKAVALEYIAEQPLVWTRRIEP